MLEELWQIHGRAPVMWSLPFYVHWPAKGAEAHCFPAVPLLRIQERAIETLLINHGRKVNGQWMLVLSELRAIGTEAQAGTDPETLVVWERPRLDQKKEFQRKKGEARSEFLDALYRRNLGFTRDEIGHWWYVFCDHMLDWMINQEKPVDLFFIRLIPVPYRRDWIYRMNRRYEFFMKSKKGGPLRTEKSFHEASMLGVNWDGTIQRYIEVQHTAFWWKTVKRVETTRLQRLNPARYAAYVIESVRKCAPLAKRLFKDFMAQKKVDSGMYVRGNRFRVMALERFLPSDNCYVPRWGTSDRYREALFIINRPRYEEMRRRYPPLPKTNVHLPAVRTVQQTAQDLRDGRRDGGDPGKT